MEDSRLAWYGLGASRVLGPKRLTHLLHALNTADAIWHATPDTLVPLLGPAITQTFLEERKTLSLTECLSACEQHGIDLLTIEDPDYPPLLRELHDPPVALYLAGRRAALQTSCISIVGSRQMTPYGSACTRELATALAQRGFTIVSGLAFGVDITAHRAALAVGGCTIAVLPGGLDPTSIAPASHARDAAQIRESGGLLISEHPPGTRAFKSHYPVRNRLIAGCSRLTLVPEANLASGSMTTARAALQENRDVGAVPGPITNPRSAGPHALIQDGAALISCVEDVLHVLGIHHIPGTHAPEPLTDQEQQLLELIQPTPTSLDDLCRRLQVAPNILADQLLQLELKQRICPAGAGHVVRVAT